MVAWNLGRTWSDRTRAYARTAQKPIHGTLTRETSGAFLISTGIRDAWVPKALVRHDAAAGTFTMPMWLALKKLLD